MEEHRHDKQKCMDLADKISAYLDGEIEGADLDTILAHLDQCGCCKQCADEIRATRDMLGKIPPPQMPEDVKGRLKACLRKKG